MQISKVHISELKSDLKNANLGTMRGSAALESSLAQLGTGRSILIDKNGTVIAGNKTLEQAGQIGIEDILIIKTDGKKLVAVQRTDLDIDEANGREMAYADNRIGQIDLEWDAEQIAADIKDGVNLDQFWSQEELDELLSGIEGFGDEAQDGECDPDTTPEVEEAVISRTGDLWLLGNHRVLCGDSAKKKDIENVLLKYDYDLLVTDPPYGVSYADKNNFLNKTDKRNRIQEKIENDHKTPEEMKEFWTKIFTAVRKKARAGAAYYVTGPQGGDLLFLLLLLSLQESEFILKHMLIWAKNNHVLGRCDYNYKHEPIFYGWVEGGHKFYGSSGEVSLWEIPKPLKFDLHPTMKPVELFARAIKNSTKKNEIVFDPFLGSGTTVIASEQLDRLCYGIEIEPKYVDVIVRRWQIFTGKKATLECNKKTFAETELERIGTK